MIGTTLRTIAALNRDLRTLFVVTFLFRAGLMAFPFLSAYLLTGEHYTPGQVSLIVAAFGFGALLADVFASMLLGRIPTRAVMTTALLGQVAVLAVVPWLTGVAPLVVATLLWGFSFEIYTPAMYSQTMQWAAPEKRKVAFACNRLAINLGMGIGPVAGGLIFAIRPVALFYVNGIAVLAALGYLAWRGRSAPAQDAPAAPPRPRRRMISPGLREETRFWTIFGLAMPIHLAYALPPVLMSAYLIAGLGLPSYWVSVVFAVNALIIVLVEVPLNHAMRGMSHARALAVGYAAAGAGFAAMGLAGHPVVLLAATVVWTIGEMIVFPGLLSYVGDLSDPTVGDRNVSLYSAGPNIGMIVAPSVSLAVSQLGNLRMAWLVIGSAVLVAMLLMFLARLTDYTWYAGETTENEPVTGADR